MNEANLVSKVMIVNERFCPICGRSYESIKWKYVYSILDEDTREEKTVFLYETNYCCDICGYRHYELDVGFCDYAEEENNDD